jgi:hypothetical protein
MGHNALADMTFLEMAWTGPSDASADRVNATFAKLFQDYAVMNGLSQDDYDATRLDPVEMEPGVSQYVEQWQLRA